MRIELRTIEQKFWQAFVDSQGFDKVEVTVTASMPGNGHLADHLISLYLNGKKHAGSGLVKDYEMAGDALPEVGSYWIMLDSHRIPRCLAKTVRTSIQPFKDVSDDIARAEGEGDLSLTYWRKVHREFFTPFLLSLGIVDLDNALVVTEFFEVVYKDPSL